MALSDNVIRSSINIINNIIWGHRGSSDVDVLIFQIKGKNRNKWVEKHNECRFFHTGALHATINIQSYWSWFRFQMRKSKWLWKRVHSWTQRELQSQTLRNCVQSTEIWTKSEMVRWVILPHILKWVNAYSLSIHQENTTGLNVWPLQWGDPVALLCCGGHYAGMV